MDEFRRLLETVERLRSPGGCEWDRAQTAVSLGPYMVEEAYEAADAAERGDWESYRGELGDLLLHVVMASSIAAAAGRFTIADVIDGTVEKLVRRHPHVFGEARALDPGEVERQWESIKAVEKGGDHFASMPRSMPALHAAWRLQQRAEDLGREMPSAGESAGRIMGAVGSVEAGDAGAEGLPGTLGELLFEVVNYIRKMGLEPERLLRGRCDSFIAGFREGM
jgi:MazG family protein